jgi:glutamate 5-kinase
MAKLCVSLEFHNVILEGDSLEVIQALCKEECLWGHYGTLINEAKLLLQNVHQWSAYYVKRTGNVAVHRLAKLALSLNEESLWREDYPLCVRQTVIDDVISM